MRGRTASTLVFLIAALAAGLTVGCAADVERDLPVSLELPLAGAQFSETFSVSGKQIPLPPGEWTVIGTQIEKDGTRGFHATHMLAQVKDGRLLAAVEVATNIPIPKAAADGTPRRDRDEGWPTHQGCVRDDIHFLKVKTNVRLGDQDCWWVNHWRMHRTGAALSEHWRKSVKYLADNKIAAPLDMIGVTYRLADKQHYLTVTYFLSPQSFACECSNNDIHWSIASWDSSVWHPDQVKKDSRKVKYLQDVIAWGESWYPKFKQLSRVGT